MCGKCVIFTYDEVLDMVRRIESGSPIITEPDWPARKAFAFPQSQATLIIPRFDTAAPPPALGTRTLAISRLSWGFQEPWKPAVVFNTRIESAGKPTWRDSMQHRRCIIPVPSFFETHHEETIPSPKTGRPIKRQYEFHMPESPIILIGCIWKEDRFSMVTTEANAHMAPIHHRMPLIVRQEELPIWFGPEYRTLADRSGIVLEAQPVEGAPGAKMPGSNPQAKTPAASPDERNDGFPTNLFDF
ncbi:MAG: SOS response-associated peptidase family protein [Eggerthellaceae bacterium]|nr:SOS response-associated peptidase family protein [Eggerthellaceae bacterium]